MEKREFYDQISGYLASDYGKEIIVRTHFNQASKVSFIIDAAALRLQLKFEPSDIEISGIGAALTFQLSVPVL